MKKGLTELVFILDRSGSMGGLERDTIGGFNGMVEKQKKEEGEAILSTVLFDDRTEILYDRVPIGEVRAMTDKDYYVRGCTALLDAVGSTIEHIKSERKKMPKEERPEKTIFIITTDGMENASRKYSYDQVKKLIEKRQEKKWEFIFLGANIDSAEEADRLGIRKGRAVDYNCDSTGTALNYKVLANAISQIRECEDCEEMDCMLSERGLFDEIKADYRKRSGD